MPISFTCGQCRNRLKVPDAHAGRRGKCRCGAIMVVPGTKAPGLADSGENVGPLPLTASSEAELVNTLAPPSDQGHPDLEHERLALERAKLAYDLRRLEREREELEQARASAPAPAPASDLSLEAMRLETARLELERERLALERARDPERDERLARLEEEADRNRDRRRRDAKLRRRQERRAELAERYRRGSGGDSAVVAFMLGFLLMGLGHVYTGHLTRALVCWAGVGVVIVLGLAVRSVDLAGLVIFTIWVGSVIDAARCAGDNS